MESGFDWCFVIFDFVFLVDFDVGKEVGFRMYKCE